MEAYVEEKLVEASIDFLLLTRKFGKFPSMEVGGMEVEFLPLK